MLLTVHKRAEIQFVIFQLWLLQLFCLTLQSVCRRHEAGSVRTGVGNLHFDHNRCGRNDKDVHSVIAEPSDTFNIILLRLPCVNCCIDQRPLLSFLLAPLFQNNP